MCLDNIRRIVWPSHEHNVQLTQLERRVNARFEEIQNETLWLHIACLYFKKSARSGRLKVHTTVDKLLRHVLPLE